MNPYQANPAGKKLMSVIAVYIAIVFSIMLSSGGSTMLPVAAKEIGGMDIYTMALTLPGVIGIALMPLFGYISARNPAIKRPLSAVAFLIAAIGIFIRGIAPDMWYIVVSSVFLSMYSPSIYVLGYSMIRDMYDQKQAGIYLGVVATMQSLGLLVGPLLTGILIQTAGWRVVNYCIFPFFFLAAIFMFLGAKVSKEEAKSMATAGGVFDAPGAIATTVFLAGLIMFLSLGQYAPFGSTISFTILAVTVVALIFIAIFVKQKGSAAFIPAPVLKDINVLCFTVANFFAIFSQMAITIFLPVYILYVMQLSASEAGIAMAIYAVAGVFMGPIVGRMIGKAGNARSIIMWGSGVLRFVCLLALFLILKPTTNIFIVYAIIFICGFYGVSYSAANAIGPQIQLKPEIRQQGNALVQLGQNFGGSASIAVYTAIMTLFGGPAKAFPVCLIIATVAAAIVFFAAIPLKKLETSATKQAQT